MSVFFNLPDDLCKSIASEWLDTKCLMMMDVATKVSIYHEQFLRIIFKVPCVAPTRHKINGYKWMHKNHLKLTELILADPLMFHDGELSFPMRFEFITRLEVRRRLVDTSDIANRCENLKELVFSDSFLKLHKVRADILAQLTALVCVDKNIPDRIVPTLCGCRNLKTLVLEKYSVADNRSSLIQVFENNPMLEHVNLHMDRQLLEVLIDCCPNLKRLEVHGGFKLAAAILALERCTQLSHLSFENGTKSFVYIPNHYFEILLSSGEVRNLSLWPQFVQMLRGITSIALLGPYSIFDDVVVLPLVDACKDSLLNLRCSCLEVDSSALRYVFDHCRLLQSVELSLLEPIDWAAVFSAENEIRIQTLKVDRWFEQTSEDLVRFFQCCPCLTSFTVSGSDFELKLPLLLIPALQQYKNALGVPLRYEMKWFINEDDAWDLIYENGEFSGELWWKYKEVLTLHSATETRLREEIQRLRDENEHLKSVLSHYHGNNGKA